MAPKTFNHQTPLGRLWFSIEQGALTALSFSGDSVDGSGGRKTDQIRDEVDAYFAGTLRNFSIEVQAEGTAFERAVWAAVRKVPFGKTATYADIATHMGLGKGAARAVGRANGKNPVLLLTPCHRIIGANGALTGYSGGLELKRKLLAHEALYSGHTLF